MGTEPGGQAFQPVLDELMDEVRQLIDAAPGMAASEVARRAERLRERIEEEMVGGEAEALGLLNDAVAALLLYARAAGQGDEERAEEYAEQARLFLAAAEQAGRAREGG